MEIITPHATIETPLSHIADYLRLIESYGRVCHKSEEHIDEDSAEPFIRKFMIEMGHESVLEHCSVTVRFVCDRSASHQLVRHRLGAYSQESQRYVNYAGRGLQVICPPSIRGRAALFERWCAAVEAAEKEYDRLAASGIPPEDARSVLPNCTKTEVVATFNLRQWRHVFRQRALNPRAQWQIRELTTDLLKQFSRLMPAIFDDLQREILYKLVFDPEKAPDAED